MRSINFPKMFTKTGTIIASDHQASMQNLALLIKSEKEELFCDPYFGAALKKFLYDPNDGILQDLVIDAIYTAIGEFMPQLVVNRNDIKLRSEGTTLYVDLKVTNKIDYETNLYSLVLFEG